MSFKSIGSILLSPEYGSYSDEMRVSPVELDLCGLNCPLPVLRTRKALRRMALGETVLVSCTDPLARIDIPHFARSEGHELRSQIVEGHITHFLIAKTNVPS